MNWTWPWMSRAAHQEIVALLREQITELKAQLHPPVTEAPVQPERPAVQDADIFEAARKATKQQLRALARTHPSLLGRAMQRVKMEEEIDKRRRAFGAHPAQALFESAKQNVS